MAKNTITPVIAPMITTTVAPLNSWISVSVMSCFILFYCYIVVMSVVVSSPKIAVQIVSFGSSIIDRDSEALRFVWGLFQKSFFLLTVATNSFR